MKNFEKLNSFRNGEQNQEELISELKAWINEMLETADKMLDRVPETVLRNIAVCGEYVDLNNAYSNKNGQRYTMSYCPDGSDEVVVEANDEEVQKLEAFRNFMLKRYGFDWSYTQIYFDEKMIHIASDAINENATQILLDHLEEAFPDIEIDI